MTTKRKAIMKAIALSTVATIDDLMTATGLQRKNLQDNLKACLSPVQLLERIRDDVTGQPAYKLTKQGREWLEKDKDDGVSRAAQVSGNTGQVKSTKSVTTQAVSGDITAAVAHCSTSLASATPGKGATVIEPPKPDLSPVAVCSDDTKDRLAAAGKTITEFCEWLAKKAKVRCPMNLLECKAVVEAFINAAGLEDKRSDTIERLQSQLEDRINVMSCTIKDAQDELVEAYRANNKWIALANKFGCNDVQQFSGFVNNAVNANPMVKSETFANLKQSDLPAGVTLKNPQPDPSPIRYIVADSYTIADCPESANAYALERVNHNGTESSVVVFEANRARELRINWSDV